MAEILTHPGTAPTTRDTIKRDLGRSLIHCGAAKKAGPTWADFKAAVEALGIADSTPIAFIEYGVSAMGSGYVIRDNDEDAPKVGVREVSL